MRNNTYVGYAHFVQQYRRSKEVSAKDHTCSDIFLLMSPLRDRRNKNDKAVDVILFHHDCMGERRMCSVRTAFIGNVPGSRKWRYLRTIAASELEKTRITRYERDKTALRTTKLWIVIESQANERGRLRSENPTVTQ